MDVSITQHGYQSLSMGDEPGGVTDYQENLVFAAAAVPGAPPPAPSTATGLHGPAQVA